MVSDSSAPALIQQNCTSRSSVPPQAFETIYTLPEAPLPVCFLPRSENLAAALFHVNVVRRAVQVRRYLGKSFIPALIFGFKNISLVF
jgi:hypothetical protein